MDVIYGLIPMVLIAGFLVVIAFIWMAKNGHFDDMDGQANRILMDDDFPEEDNKSKEEGESKVEDSDVAETKELEKKESSKKDV